MRDKPPASESTSRDLVTQIDLCAFPNKILVGGKITSSAGEATPQRKDKLMEVALENGNRHMIDPAEQCVIKMSIPSQTDVPMPVMEEDEVPRQTGKTTSEVQQVDCEKANLCVHFANL